MRKYNHKAKTSSILPITSMTVHDDSDGQHNDTKDVINLI